jgi:ankyrin repeat protein
MMELINENKSQPDIRYVEPSEMSAPEKASGFVETPEGGYIRVNKKYRDSFDSFWREHEIGHWEYFNKHVLPKIEKPVTDEKIDKAMDKIRDEGYPNNEEERHAFKRQIDYLRSHGWSDRRMMEKFKDEYDRKHIGTFEVFKPVLEQYLKIDECGAEQYENIVSESVFKSPSSSDIESRKMSHPFALIKASEKNNISLVKKLLDMGVDVNVKDDDGSNALMMASKNGYEDVVKMLLDRGADVNVENKYGNNALMSASMYGNTEIVKLLLDKGADVNVENKYGNNALIYASSNGHKEIVKMLLDKGIDVNVKNKDGDNALMLASRNGYIDIVELLKQHGAIKESVNESIFKPVSPSDIESRQLKNPNAIVMAARKHDIALVKRLIDKGVDVNTKNSHGLTPLVVSANNGFADLAAMLLDMGADVNATTNGGDSALMTSSWYGHISIVRMLLAKGAVVNIVNKHGNTALIIASMNGRTEIAEMLIDKGADVNARNIKGYNALKLASLNGNYDTAELLKQHGAEEPAGEIEAVNESVFKHLSGDEVRARKRENPAAIVDAARRNRVSFVRELLDMGVDVNARDGGGMTALTWAACYGRKNLAGMLIGAGADVNSSNPYGRTALQYAANGGHLEIVNMLLDAGADANAATTDGLTPLKLAARRKFDAVADMLRRHGAVDESVNESIFKPPSKADIPERDKHNPYKFIRILQSKKVDETNIDQVLDMVDDTTDVNKKYVGHLTPLMLCTMLDQPMGLRIVRKLLANPKINVNIRDLYHETALSYAIHYMTLDIAREIMRHPGFDVNDCINSDKDTALTKSIRRDLLPDMIAFILETPGIDVNKQDYKGWTPLMAAANRDAIHTVKLLLAHDGIDVNRRDIRYKTALDHAYSPLTGDELRKHGAKFGKELAKVNESIFKPASHDDVMERILKYPHAIFEYIKNHDTAIVKDMLEKGADVNISQDDGNRYTPLIMAVRNDYEDIAKLLLGHGAGVAVKDKEGNTALHWAVKKQYVGMLKTLLEHAGEGAVDIPDGNGNTPLMCAVYGNQVRIVEMLLDAGARKELRDDRDDDAAEIARLLGRHNMADLIERHGSVNESIFKSPSPSDIESRALSKPLALIQASMRNNISLVKKLLDMDVDVNKENYYGNTALMMASYKGHEKIVRMLLDRGANVTIRNRDADNALMLADRNRHNEIVDMLKKHMAVNKNMNESIFSPPSGDEVKSRQYDKYRDTTWFPAASKNIVWRLEELLKEGQDINAKTSHKGYTALYIAAGLQCYDAAEFLIGSGADVNLTNNEGDTPLIAAVHANDIPMVEMLLDKGADMSVKNIYGTDALAIARHMGRLAICDMLEERKNEDNVNESIFKSPSPSDIESRKMRYPLALITASRTNNISIVKKLLDMDVDVNVKNKDGRNALMLASLNGNTKIVKMLLDKGADVNVKDNNGDNALMWASLNGNTEIVKMLLDKGADVNEKNKYGYNALMLASSNGYIDIVKMLIDKGVDVNVKSKYGENALMWASIDGYKEIVKMLKQHDAVNENMNESIFKPVSRTEHVHRRKEFFMRMNWWKAADNNVIWRMKQMLDAGQNINARMPHSGYTALHSACMAGHSAMANFLIDNGAELDIRENIDGDTPLMLAVMANDPATINLLLDKGADLIIKNNSGRNALEVARNCGRWHTFRLIKKRMAETSS